MQSFGQKAAESSVPHESIVNLLNPSRTPHAFQNTRLRRQSPRNAVCKNETEKSAEFCVYRVGLHHCRTVPLQNSTSRIVCEISAGFCISHPKLTIRKSPLPDSKKVIKRISSITMFRKTRTWGKRSIRKNSDGYKAHDNSAGHKDSKARGGPEGSRPTTCF